MVELWIATMQAVVGALVDSAGRRVVGMALAEGDEVPDEAPVWVLNQLKHETERGLGCPLTPERHVQLAATKEARSVSVDFAPLPAVESDRNRRKVASRRSHERTICAVGK